jgi:hypothetical protein
VKKPATPARQAGKLRLDVRAAIGHAPSLAREHAFATKIQRQPFAPFRLSLSVHPIAVGSPEGAP